MATKKKNKNKKPQNFGYILYNIHIDVLFFKMYCEELIVLQENSQICMFKDV